MTDIIVTAWKRYGHDRGYATAADGTKLGWIDAKTAAVIIEDGADAVAVHSALKAWLAARDLDVVEPSTANKAPNAPIASVCIDATAVPFDEPERSSVPPPEQQTDVAWTDLAANRPGEGVQAEADAAWEVSKQGSKFFSFTNRYIFDVKTDERAWRVGAEGERAIGERLNKLRDQGWRVLHSIPVGSRGSDIDHVVVGPGGVFTINSKNHPGGKIWVAKYQMRVNGHVVPYLRNASHEATRASKLLSAVLGYEVPVRSCVVVLTGTIVPEVKIKEMPDDVMVLDRMDVPRWFKKRKPVLTAQQVDAIYEVARKSSTWV